MVGSMPLTQPVTSKRLINPTIMVADVLRGDNV